MTREGALRFWATLTAAHPNRIQFGLPLLLQTFRAEFPHLVGDGDERAQLAALLDHLRAENRVRLPDVRSRRSFHHAERTLLPNNITRLDRPAVPPQQTVLWRPELTFARTVPQALQEELRAVQDWLRSGGAAKPMVAVRERSVEIFGDEKRIDRLLGTTAFKPGNLSLEMLRCYLPTFPVILRKLLDQTSPRPLLVVENHTTFDTMCRWNTTSERYCAIAFGAGTAFVASASSLPNAASDLNRTARILYFGDIDPTGLWIPAKAADVTGLSIVPDTGLYRAVLRNADTRRNLPLRAFAWDEAALGWLKEPERSRVAAHFTAGRRVAQELLTHADLEATDFVRPTPYDNAV